MFKLSASCSQPDLFSNFESHFTAPKQAQLNDAKSWHNLFYEHLGRPNAPIRQLFAMMIMKEGFGWSDAQLFEHCRFNILVMRALGLMNLSDEVPVESTYYLFKQALYTYQLNTGQEIWLARSLAA